MVTAVENKQFYQLCLMLFFLLIMSINSYANSTVLRLVVPNFPPYTYLKEGKAAGIGVEKVKKIMADTNISYSIKVVKDYGLAFLLMQTGKADGMFLASRNSERDQIATQTNAVMFNRWCWYFKADSTLTPLKRRFKRMAKVGTILNTNTQKWLRKNGYRVAGRPDNASALNKMLLTDRINAVFLAEEVFELVIPADQYYRYHKIIAVEKSFGIYINKQYINKNPMIIKQLNSVITTVKPTFKNKHNAFN